MVFLTFFQPYYMTILTFLQLEFKKSVPVKKNDLMLGDDSLWRKQLIYM